MGSSLSSPDVVSLNLEAAQAVKARGGTVSFDPNLRKEILAAPGMAEAMAAFLALTDLYLPSGAELTLLTKAQDEAGAVAELLAGGITAIVHKLGAEGVRFHAAQGGIFVPAFTVEEVDPTGAGDCFAGNLLTRLAQGDDWPQAVRYANAAAALSVQGFGAVAPLPRPQAVLALLQKANA